MVKAGVGVVTIRQLEARTHQPRRDTLDVVSLIEAVNMLAAVALPPRRYFDHPLSGEWSAGAGNPLIKGDGLPPKRKRR